MGPCKHDPGTRYLEDLLGQKPRCNASCETLSRPMEIWCAVAEAKDRGEPIDNALFEKVGVKFRLSSTETKKRYALWCKRIGKP